MHTEERPCHFNGNYTYSDDQTITIIHSSLSEKQMKTATPAPTPPTASPMTKKNYQFKTRSKVSAVVCCMQEGHACTLHAVL